MNLPPPKPIREKQYSHDDLTMHLIEQNNTHLNHAIEALTISLNAAQENIKQLSVIVENLSVKVGVLSDICWKGGGTLIVMFLSSFVTWYLAK